MNLVGYVLVLISSGFFYVSTEHSNKLLVDELRWNFLNLENDLWDMVLSHTKGPDFDAEMAILEHLHDFDHALQTMPQDILRGLTVAKNIHPFLFLYADLKQISNLYDKFRKYLQEELAVNEVLDAKIKNTSPEDMISDIMNPATGVNKTITNIFNLTFGDENMLLQMFEEITDQDYMCKSYNQSPQQGFYNLYNSIALTGLKGYIMQQFALLMTNIYNKGGNETEQSLQIRNQFGYRVNQTITMFKGAMMMSPRDIWRCDPKTHVKGKTYEEFTRLLQGHIQNEADLNSDRSCRQSCNSYAYTQSYGCYDYESSYCQEMKRCTGTLHACHFIESHMDVCIAPSWSTRRIEYIRLGSGQELGKSEYCNKKSVYSWYRWFVHCSTCMCLCDEQGLQSDRFVNLRAVMANASDNRVVTGLRWAKKNRIMHLQIQEGKLLPQGYIDEKTVRWVPIDDYSKDDFNVKKDVDYHVLTYDSRSMMFDFVHPHEENYIITGVKMGMVRGKIAFHIIVEDFDFANGTLLGNSHFIYGTGNRYWIELKKPDISTLSPPSVPMDDSQRIVMFTNTDYSKDAAQTTVPFFDLQPAVSDPAVPLRGAGIYFKGRDGYGGFVAPKIQTYDFVRHMTLELPPVNDRLGYKIEPLVN